MKTLTIIAATIYALLLWLFAPQKTWDLEVEKAKMNRNKPTLQTPEKPETIEDIQDTQDTQTPHTATETAYPLIDTPEKPKPQTWTVAQLRKEAQQRQIKWKDENGKPYKKDELMRFLEL